MIDERAIRERYEAARSHLDERGRRLFAAVEVRAAGRGGIAAVARATGLGRTAIKRGLKDLDQPPLPAGRIRRRGGGRRSLTSKDPTLLEDLERLIEPAALGKSFSPLLWVCKSHVMLADALQTMGHTVSPNSVRKLLRELGYHRQANRRAFDERHHNDRSAQLEYIGEKIIFFLDKNQPVISVEVKKRVVKNKLKIEPVSRLADQLREGLHVGNSRNNTREDNIIFDDVSDDDKWVSVGVTGSAVEFLITAIRSWFETIGKQLYPRASHLAITINCGGLEKTGLLLWKHWLQDLADEIRMTISVLHLPPATTKWRKVEHRLLCQHVSQNCRGQPSISRLAVIELVGASTEAHFFSSENEISIKIGRENAKFNLNDVAALNIQCDAFQPNWNYAIAPRSATKR